MIGDRFFKFLLRFPILKWWVSVTCQPSPDGNFSSLRTNTDLFSWRKHTTTSTSLQITRVFFASYVQLCPAMSSSSLSFRLSMTEKTRNQVPQLTFQWNNSSKCHSQKKKCHSFQKNRPASNRLNTKSELDLIHQSPPVSTQVLNAIAGIHHDFSLVTPRAQLLLLEPSETLTVLQAFHIPEMVICYIANWKMMENGPVEIVSFQFSH